MNRYPSPIVKVAFDGPDVRDESLYNILRVSHNPCYIILYLFLLGIC